MQVVGHLEKLAQPVITGLLGNALQHFKQMPVDAVGPPLRLRHRFHRLRGGAPALLRRLHEVPLVEIHLSLRQELP